MSDEVQLSLRIDRDLAALRWRVNEFAMQAGLTGRRLQDLVLAVNEAASNVLEHGGESGTLLAGADEHGVWIDVIDGAGGLTAEHLYRLGGELPPAASSGYGLWLIRRLCDEVHLDHPDGCSRLRLHMRHQPAAEPAASPRPDTAGHPASSSGDFVLYAPGRPPATAVFQPWTVRHDAVFDVDPSRHSHHPCPAR
jgi:anti-sigma regulatory factor (Ser/Thr protein kinase)